MTDFNTKYAIRSVALERRAGYDVRIFLLTLILCLVGAVFVMTSSAVHSWQKFDGDSMSIFWSHLQKIGLGMFGLIIFSLLDYHRIEKSARPLIYFSILLLILVLFVPQPAKATAHRWLRILGFSFQPAEFAKFALIVFLAMKLASHHRDPFAYDRKKINQGCLLFSFVVLGLIVKEPNLSMALLVMGVVAVMLYLSGVKVKRLLVIGGICLPFLGLIAWYTAYMRTRLIEYAEGIMDPLHASHQVKQSLIGIGHGGLTGVGLGASTQKHFFLPEPYKDFIFSIVGEEIGLIGAGCLLIIFLAFLTRAWRVARLAPDPFGYYLAAGITASIAMSFVINVGVTIGLLPATGQPLPFISYGGSSLVMSLCTVGVLLNISRQIQRYESIEPRMLAE